jgi:hypothetical protein
VSSVDAVWHGKAGFVGGLSPWSAAFLKMLVRGPAEAVPALTCGGVFGVDSFGREVNETKGETRARS